MLSTRFMFVRPSANAHWQNVSSAGVFLAVLFLTENRNLTIVYHFWLVVVMLRVLACRLR